MEVSLWSSHQLTSDALIILLEEAINPGHIVKVDDCLEGLLMTCTAEQIAWAITAKTKRESVDLLQDALISHCFELGWA